MMKGLQRILWQVSGGIGRQARSQFSPVEPAEPTIIGGQRLLAGRRDKAAGAACEVAPPPASGERCNHGPGCVAGQRGKTLPSLGEPMCPVAIVSQEDFVPAIPRQGHGHVLAHRTGQLVHG